MTIQDKLKGKKILFLSVQTFNYEKEIAQQLQKLGAIVDYFDERPANSIIAKGIIRLKRSLYQKQINDYYHQIIKSISGKSYDYLFVIKGEVVPAFFLESFKSTNPKCHCIFYTWDSFENNVNARSILKYFDDCFTFDANDAVKYNLNFRPLFYIEKYGNLSIQKNSRNDFDLLFIGTAHSDRYIISNTLVRWCESNGLNSYAYYFMQSRIVFAFKKFFDSTFKKIEYNKLSFESLSADNIIDLYKRSFVVLDINHPKQSGLTMRTFEALGAGKKLITTNKEIKNYSFYNENNICIIDREFPKLKKDFFETTFVPIENELLNNMSIMGWITELFMEKKSNYWIDNLS
jgi:hypothetical protein